MAATRRESGALYSQSGEQARPCPICGKPSVCAARPFCSKRCADIDLHHWLCGTYTIPARQEPDAGGGDLGEHQGAESPETKS